MERIKRFPFLSFFIPILIIPFMFTAERGYADFSQGQEYNIQRASETAKPNTPVPLNTPQGPITIFWDDFEGGDILAGGTDSGNLPTTPGAYDSTHNGSGDAFIARSGPDPAVAVNDFALGRSVSLARIHHQQSG